MSEQKIAVFDCDDVLANCRDIFKLALTEILGYEISVEDLINFDISSIFPAASWDLLSKWMIENHAFERMKPEIMASQTVRHFHDECNYKTIVLTARGFHPKAQELTEEWLKVYNIPIDEVIVVLETECKSKVLKELGEVDFYVEDNHDHTEAACGLDNVKRIFLIDRPWNRDGECGERISCISDVIDKINI